MAAPQLKVVEGKAVVEASGKVELTDSPTLVSDIIGEEFLYAGRLLPSPEMQEALNGAPAKTGELYGLKNIDYEYGIKLRAGEVLVEDGSIHINLGSKLSIVDGKSSFFAATDGERLIQTELTDDIERIFRPRWNVKLDTENPRSSVAGWEFKTGKALTQFTLSEDKETLTVTIADPKKNFLCSLMCENLEATDRKPEMQIFKMTIRQGDRGVILKVNPENESYQMVGSFNLNENIVQKAGVEFSEEQIKEIMGISYSHKKIGTIDFNVEFTGNEFECSLKADIGKILKKKP